MRDSLTLEKVRQFAWEQAERVAIFKDKVHELDMSIDHSKWIDSGQLRAANLLCALANAYESMVEAMYREHDCAVKHLQEGNALREEVRQLKEKNLELSVHVTSLKGDVKHLREALSVGPR